MLSHLKIKKRISKFVLMPGDPERVDLIGKKLKDFKIIGNNREFKTGIGTYKGLSITICSTGIGCPSTAIATEELIDAGAEYLIRVGTCGGSWRKDIKLGSVIIPTASIRDEGTTLEYIPQGFPAVANLDIVSALDKSAKRKKVSAFVGINRTHDAFYGSQETILRWGKYLNEERWQKMKIDTPILSSEMESAALFVIATLRDVKAGAIFAVNGNPEPLLERLKGRKQKVTIEASQKTSEEVVDAMIDVALLACVELNKDHKFSPG